MVRSIAKPGCLPSPHRPPAKSSQSLPNHLTRNISLIVGFHLPPQLTSSSLTGAGAEHTLGIIHFAANETSTDVDSTSTSAVEGPSGSTIPWRISNKYYTADVHFECITIDGYLSRRNEFDGVPAVLIVWNRGQVRLQSLA